MAGLTSLFAWFLLVALIVAPVAYVSLGSPDTAFLDNVMSGLLATAGALIGGIPVALWLDRTIKSGEEKRQRRTERKRELELLEIIREELTFSLSGLARRQANPGAIEVQPLKSDLWAAVSAAGKLNLIENHRLLNRITSAYYVINVVRRIEEQAYKALRGPTVTFSNGQTAIQLIWSDARRFDGLLNASLVEAIGDIDTETGRSN